MKKIYFLFALMMSSWVNAQVSTPVVGFNKLNFPAGNSAQTATFTKASVFQGVATSKTQNSITVSGAAFPSYAPVGGLPAYYVKILGGALDGYTFDVLSNTSTTLTISGDLSQAGTTPTFLVRPHVKASDLFKSSTGLTPGLDTLTVFNSDATSTVLLWVSTDSSTGWIDVLTEAVADAVVYPGQGFILTTVAAGTFTFQGQVETSSTVVPLYPGTVNLVSRSNPSTSSASIQGIGLGNNLTPGLDTTEFWSRDGANTSTAVLLWAGVDGFIDNLTEQISIRAVEPNEVMNVTVVSPTTWKVSPPLSQ